MEQESARFEWVGPFAVLVLVISIGGLVAGIWRGLDTATVILSAIGIISSAIILFPRRAKN